MWKRSIEIRNAELMEANDAANWYPFTKNIQEMINRFEELESLFELMENRVDETMGLILSLRKSLKRIGFLDEEFKLNWTAVKKIEELIKDEPEEE